MIRGVNSKIAAMGLVTLTVVILSYSNCSDSNLSRGRQTSAGSAQGISGVDLPPAKLQFGDMRIVFFVDQSFSMVQGKCPSDLDGADPKMNDQKGSCPKPDPGTDPDAHRYEILKKWLDELDVAAANADIQVAVIPFSGGIKARPNYDVAETEDSPNPPPDNTDYFKFLDLKKARARTEHLLDEHKHDLALTRFGGHATGKFMGTTVPLTTLQRVTTIMRREMDILSDQGRAESTHFHLVYFSDGVFKPLSILKEKAMQLSGCPINKSIASCAELIQGIPCLTCPEAGSDMCSYGLYCTDGLCPREFCDVERTRFDRYFGSPLSNHDVAFLTTQIKGLEEYALRKKTNFHANFLQLHPEKIVDAKEKDQPWNIFDKILDDLDPRHTRKYEIVDGNKPFSFALTGSNLTYELLNFYIVNLNAFVDAHGKLRTDSDGDGLADEEDPKPQVSRSQDKRCYDGIYKLYGCTASLSCQMERDSDGDGLNECEEVTLRTSDQKEDSDDDQFLDIHETLRGINPNLRQDNATNSPDGQSVIDHFIKGASSVVDLRKVLPQNLIDYRLDYLGTKKITGPLGTPIEVGTYYLAINNVPVVQTKSAKQTAQVYKDVGKAKRVPREEYLGPTKHEAGINQILVLAKVVSKENPNDYYWLLKRLDVPANGNGTVRLNLNFNDFVQIGAGTK